MGSVTKLPAKRKDDRRAKPTPADIAAAGRLKAIWDRKKDGLGLTQDKMAEALDGTQGLVSQYLNGKIPLNFKTLLAFARELEIDPAEVRTDLPEQRLTSPGHVESDWTDVRASTQSAALGGGMVPDEYAEAHKLKFKASSLRRKGLRPERLQVYYGAGDSMEPRIRDGDAVLVDTADTRVSDDRIYFIRHEHHFFVKRLQAHGDMVFIVSDNRDDPQWRKPVLVKPGDDFEVIGRVRWIGSWED